MVVARKEVQLESNCRPDVLRNNHCRRRMKNSSVCTSMLAVLLLALASHANAQGKLASDAALPTGNDRNFGQRRDASMRCLIVSHCKGVA